MKMHTLDKVIKDRQFLRLARADLKAAQQWSGEILT